METDLSILVLDDVPRSALTPLATMLRAASDNPDLTENPPWNGLRIGGTTFNVSCDVVRDKSEVESLFGDLSRLEKYALILLDNDWEKAQAPHNFGIQVLAHSEKQFGEGPFVAVFTYAETFVHSFVADALAAGADGLVRKDETTHLLNCLLMAFERQKKAIAWKRWKRLSGLLATKQPHLASESPAMLDALSELGDYAVWKDEPVLLLGQPGTGKTTVARAIHECSPRADKPFARVDIAGMTDSLIEAELFGSTAGAYTDAVTRKGIIEAAEGGTVFIDEVQNIPLLLQPKLLSVIEEKTYRRPGETEERRADVRFIFASNQDLRALVDEERFRKDLFQRINVLTTRLPDLDSRRDDIGAMAKIFIQEFLTRNGLPPDAVTLTDQAVAELLQRSWPDNIRGLRNVIARSMARLHAPRLDAGDLDFGDADLPQTTFDQRDVIRALKVAPRSGGQRRVFERLLETAPAVVKDSELQGILGATDATEGGAGQTLMQIISKLRNRLDDQGLWIDRKSDGYRLVKT